ncbi:DUF262 domain-containing protein [Brucella intermedia]|nr:DUF262 domain-containing protein [Brucella intermedia]PJT26894.1 DUF262 domain-containing protein [Ochrobactrum sp. 30A/1000/2015]PJT38314.1 DUF262 domain-containing protein [Ochrobactrum sp. 27A/999/2015]PJT44333.1 DUF262 domain-containing protein [Ochrobactrum sp. 23A/997/2015]KAB2714349.1 DUF262 domain-containing protein [Brucella intermedia]MDL2203334.1 DUF262 domain-containing protein [Brucella intermedia]
MGEPLTIRKLINRISIGDIRIPAFQREYVWEADQVAFLLDSIYKGFPIGTIILWKTDNRLNTEKKLGSFTLPEPQKDYPVNYVLDGQQRITSLFSVFQTDLTPDNDDFVDVYYDMEAHEDIQESLFICMKSSEADVNRHFPVKTLFDASAYRDSTLNLPKEKLDKVVNLQDRFKEYLIPNETFESGDRNKVAIVFERINRAGTQLEIFELLTAWSWSDDFDLVEKFDTLQDQIAEHGYEDLCNDQDLQLKICSGVILGRTTPKDIIGLRGEEIRQRFSEIERGIVGAIDFLKRELDVQQYKLLPFPAIMVPLSVFFATEKPEGHAYSDKQKRIITQWFWRSLFTRRFSSDVNERQAHDIIEFRKLKVDENHDFRMPKAENSVFFMGNFSAGNANSKTLILLLNSMKPHSFVSGAKIDTSKILKKASKHEYHHIFPRKHLEREGENTSHINVLANICFLTRSDNNAIRDKSPAQYINEFRNDNISTYIKEALCPDRFEELDYPSFLQQRISLLNEAALRLMGEAPVFQHPEDVSVA